jgi:hypothetical protein
MRVDIRKKELLKVLEVIHKLENMDFSEIIDGNKQSDIYEIISVLGDFKEILKDEIDE